jgi:hypothetical protein
MADIRQTGILDDFVRPPEDPLSGGGNWTQTDATFLPPLSLESSGYVTHEDPGVSGDSKWVAQTFDPADGNVEVWGCAIGGGTGAAGIAWSLDLWQGPGATGYRLRQEYSLVGGAAIQLYVMASGGQIGGAGVGGGSGSGEMLLFRRNGTNLEAWTSFDDGANWTLMLDVTETTFPGPYNLGLGIRDNSGGQALAWGCFGGGVQGTHHTRIIRWVTN